MIEARIIKDSINLKGSRITTMVVTMPRIILAELNTHRVFSRNSASSRAIPFEKMVKSVEENPFIPIAWQKDHKGMQGNEYFTDEKDISWLKMNHIKASKQAIERAIDANERGLTKQICNRYLEPFMWHTVIITATDWENFFALRCPQYTMNTSDGNYRSKKDLLKAYPADNSILKDTLYWLSINKGQAEIHMMALAEAMWDEFNTSVPNLLAEGEWHLPFIELDEKINLPDDILVKISTARNARVSYTVVGEGTSYDAAKDVLLHDGLLKNGHASPLEHIARVDTSVERSRNFTDGWLQYREIQGI